MKSFRCARAAHAHQLILLTSIMAARGHVQDPNDRRLRPIYGNICTIPLGLYTHAGHVSDVGPWTREVDVIKGLRELWRAGAACATEAAVSIPLRCRVTVRPDPLTLLCPNRWKHAFLTLVYNCAWTCVLFTYQLTSL